MRSPSSHNHYSAILLLLLLLSACTGKSTPATPSPEIQLSPASPTVAIQPSASLSPTQTASPEPFLTHAPESLATSTTQLSATPSFPVSHYIPYVFGHKQTYELGCEASAAVDWAGFFGVPIIEYTLQTSLPLSDNPDYGFVGEVTTDGWGQIPPYAYGVHAEPIAQALQAYDLPAKAVRGYSLDEVKQKLSDNKPIIVWVIGNMVYSDPVEYVDEQGRVAIVAPYEHVVILTGYSETHIRYMNNGRYYDTPIDVFLTSWGVLGNMAVIYE